MPSDLDAATFVLALLAFLMSGTALAWQAVTFFLSGSRLECELLMGAANPFTRQYMTQPAGKWEGLTQGITGQGFSQERVFIVARNKGRLPMSVDGYRLVTNTGQSFGQTTTEPWEDKVPKRLEPGESAMWSFPADLMTDGVALIESQPHIAKTAKGGVIEVRGEVESGTGKKAQSKEARRFSVSTESD
ncbi:hypothetical protein O2W15_16945 [Modestobacter sp. VKM Ac-2979]|uniref:hypothetical protein n=1 Tax=unclassified Modestobacter TaxID=2643866 RepID=UPI0022ABABF3|nr:MULTISPECIES: hypothetical protein [unclassified Modestobacter]MCZ2813121.1 hypothetical protein [Modestobacter sp. VKM Ac-2979]MCZ2842850.1 hypothetical protein [Modestobacter sp. VKM Ac-2980]